MYRFDDDQKVKDSSPATLDTLSKECLVMRTQIKKLDPECEASSIQGGGWERLVYIFFVLCTYGVILFPSNVDHSVCSVYVVAALGSIRMGGLYSIYIFPRLCITSFSYAFRIKNNRMVYVKMLRVEYCDHQHENGRIMMETSDHCFTVFIH